MQFRTGIDIPKSPWHITHNMRGIAIGSCFTSYIGEALAQAKFPILVHPFGTVYNPVSIAQSFEVLFGKTTITEHDLVQNAGVWTSFLLHGSYSHIHKQDVIAAYKNRISEYTTSHAPLDYVIISLGTAWVYEYAETGAIVSNCHKFPASAFHRKRLCVNETKDALRTCIALIREQSPTCKILYTISPIRHWKDGAHENQVSKSILFVALEEVMKDIPDVYYFPAYEIVMDELRDYRFYAEDMLHPNTTAVSYIYDRFCNTYFSDQTKQITAQILDIQKAMQHKPYHPASEEFVKFKRVYSSKTQNLANIYPWLDVTEETAYFRIK